MFYFWKMIKVSEHINKRMGSNKRLNYHIRRCIPTQSLFLSRACVLRLTIANCQLLVNTNVLLANAYNTNMFAANNETVTYFLWNVVVTKQIIRGNCFYKFNVFLVTLFPEEIYFLNQNVLFVRLKYIKCIKILMTKALTYFVIRKHIWCKPHIEFNGILPVKIIKFCFLYILFDLYGKISVHAKTVKPVFLFCFVCFYSCDLKMLGLYLYTLIIGHESCNKLSVLNKLELQKELQNCVTNNVFWDKK